MTSPLFRRTALGVLTSLAVLLPLAACSGGDPVDRARSSSRATDGTEPETSTGTGYADGTYTARGVYGGAPSHMDFTLTIADDEITDVSSELMAENHETSRGYQESFAAALPDEVLGKSIDEAEVAILAGASGCSDGFNDALAKIRDEARNND